MKSQFNKGHLKKGILLFFLFLYPVLGLAQEQAEVITILPSRIEEAEIIQLPKGPKSFDFDLFESRIQALWFKRKAFLNANRLDEAERNMVMLKSFCQQEDIKRLPAIALALTFEGIKFFQEGNFEKAKMSFQHAVTFDPSLVQPRIALAETYWKSDGNIWKALREIMVAASLLVQNFWTILTLSSNIFILFLFSIGSMFIVYSLLMALKYNKRFRHEIEDYFEGRRRSKPATKLLGWFFFLLPIFTLIGGLFICFYWTIILFRHMRLKEKIITCAFLIVLIFATTSLLMVRSVYHVAVDEEVRISLESAASSYDPGKIIKLQEKIKNRPDDITYHFLIAGIYKRGGYYQESFNHYLKVLDLNPHSYQALNNIGNIFFKFGQFSQAITYYKKALQTNPEFILAYLNLSLAQTENFHFKDAEETMQKARAIDAEEIARWISNERDLEGAEAIDATINTANIWKKALKGKTSMVAKDSDTDEGSFHYGVYFNLLSIASLTSLFILLLLTVKGSAGIMQCVKCGRIYCPRCGFYKEFPDYCTHCVHLFIKKDGLEPNAEAIKLKEIKRHELIRKNMTRLIGLIFPGSKHIFGNKTVVGLFLLFLWFFSIWGLFIRKDLLNISEPGMISFSSAAYPVFLALLIFSWVLGNIRFSRRNGGRTHYGS